MVVCGDLWSFVVISGGLWWFAMVCGGLSYSHTGQFQLMSDHPGSIFPNSGGG